MNAPFVFVLQWWLSMLLWEKTQLRLVWTRPESHIWLPAWNCLRLNWKWVTALLLREALICLSALITITRWWFGTKQIISLTPKLVFETWGYSLQLHVWMNTVSAERHTKWMVFTQTLYSCFFLKLPIQRCVCFITTVIFDKVCLSSHFKTRYHKMWSVRSGQVSVSEFRKTKLADLDNVSNGLSYLTSIRLGLISYLGSV